MCFGLLLGQPVQHSLGDVLFAAATPRPEALAACVVQKRSLQDGAPLNLGALLKSSVGGVSFLDWATQAGWHSLAELPNILHCWALKPFATTISELRALGIALLLWLCLWWVEQSQTGQEIGGQVATSRTGPFTSPIARPQRPRPQAHHLTLRPLQILCT